MWYPSFHMPARQKKEVAPSIPKKPLRTVVVHDMMQEGYRYACVERPGKGFRADFRPELTPKQMLELGVFGGRYMTDCRNEFPASWFTRAKLAPNGPNRALNYFRVMASQPLGVWRVRGWINQQHDPRGWFQWYCRYYMGRRLPMEDDRQIRRWKAISRHIAQLRKHCKKGDVGCRPVQRQAVLHWAYDSRKM